MNTGADFRTYTSQAWCKFHPTLDQLSRPSLHRFPSFLQSRARLLPKRLLLTPNRGNLSVVRKEVDVFELVPCRVVHCFKVLALLVSNSSKDIPKTFADMHFLIFRHKTGIDKGIMKSLGRS